MTKQDRIYQDSDGGWFVRLRGNQTMGPYANRAEAEAGLRRHMSSVTGKHPIAKAPRRAWNPRTWLSHSEPRHN